MMGAVYGSSFIDKLRHAQKRLRLLKTVLLPKASMLQEAGCFYSERFNQERCSRNNVIFR
jgi:hypothetical protein